MFYLYAHDLFVDLMVGKLKERQKMKLKIKCWYLTLNKNVQCEW